MDILFSVPEGEIMVRTEKTSKKKGFRGISLNLSNFIMICIGVVVALLMVHANYQTNENYHLMDAAIRDSILSQESTGKMESISSSMSGSALAFVETGDPRHVFAYIGQQTELNSDFGSNGMLSSERQKEDLNLAQAVSAFDAIRNTEWSAMRLKADVLPIPLSSLPELLQRITLSDEDAALSNDEKEQKASSMLNSPEYIGLKTQLAGSVDASHRFVSERASERTAKASALLRGVVLRQRILIIVFIVIAFLALIMNRVLVLQPINRSAELLDRRQPIPVRGSAEMRHLARIYNDVLQDNQAKTEALSYTASHDALTGLWNRAAFDKAVRLYRGGRIGILFVDVDHFKQFNDDYGHDTGDRVLVRVADTLKHHFREEDHISRIGGDEFCVILLDVCQEQADHIYQTVSKINESLAASAEDLPSISISVGAAFWDRPDPAADIVKDADTALLQVKKSRASNCFVYGSPAPDSVS